MNSSNESQFIQKFFSRSHEEPEHYKLIRQLQEENKNLRIEIERLKYEMSLSRNSSNESFTCVYGTPPR